MKTNAIIIRITFCISIVSLFGYLICYCECMQDISLAIFGSAILAFIIAIISYFNERKKSLENFYRFISLRIHYWTTYSKELNNNDKCQYFINYYEREFADIGFAYSEIYFLFDRSNVNRNYIFNEIYKPCYNLGEMISKRYWNFRWYVDGTGKNKIVTDMIKEIEDRMDEIVEQLMIELNGRYCKIMYGKKNYQRLKNN